MDSWKTFTEDADAITNLPFKFVKVDNNRIIENIKKIRRGGLNTQIKSDIKTFVDAPKETTNTLDKLNEGRVLWFLITYSKLNHRILC